MENSQQPCCMTISPHRILRVLFLWLIACEILLVFLDATVNQARFTNIDAIRRLVNLTRDDSLGDWFASMQTLLVGLALWLVYLRERIANRGSAWGWALIATFFCYLAADDGAKIHERVGTALQDAAWAADFPSYTWQLVFGPFFGAMGLFIAIFMWRELAGRKQRLRLVMGLSCYVIAVGLDFAEGSSGDTFSAIQAVSSDPEALRHLSKVMEEFIEMLGTTFFFVCALGHFVKISPVFTVQFGTQAAGP